MISRVQRERELIQRGVYSAVKDMFSTTEYSIPDKYFMLIADYVDCIYQNKDYFKINPIELAETLPKLISKIEETFDLVGYGVTLNDENVQGKLIIKMKSNNTYEQMKLYFFHELTHVLQTRGNECSFYNGHNGMFLAEGATQYTAEYLYNFSNATMLNNRKQINVVRCQPKHICYSPLSEYQLNGNILNLIAQTVGLSMDQILALGFDQNGRKILKERYESIEDNKGKFEELMDDLEKIYSIDKCIIGGYSVRLSGEPVDIEMENGETFKGNLKIQNDLIHKVEQELIKSYILNHDDAYILENYQGFYKVLTTPELQEQFSIVIDKIERNAIQRLQSNNRR